MARWSAPRPPGPDPQVPTPVLVDGEIVNFSELMKYMTVHDDEIALSTVIQEDFGEIAER